MKEFIKQELQRNFPKMYRAGKVLFRGAKMLGLTKPLMKIISKTAQRIPSYADGGLIKAPRRVGKIIKVHDGELVIPAKQVPSVLNKMPHLLGRPGHGRYNPFRGEKPPRNIDPMFSAAKRRRRPKVEVVRPQLEEGVGMQKGLKPMKL